MQITVVGMGYVGTVAAPCLADSGNDVVVVDINPTKIAQLNAGQSPVMEFGLAELIAQNVERGRLHATDDLEHCFLNSEATIICVGTPSGPLGDVRLTDLERVPGGDDDEPHPTRDTGPGRHCGRPGRC